MTKNTPTKQVLKLADALEKRGVIFKLEHWDGHKHVDIFIPKDNIYIEIDGMHHQTQPDRIISDFNRDYFSFKNNFFTKHITNEAIETHVEEIADAISAIIKNAPNKIGKNLK
jgi:very-short-patch-repair endonuclease